ncbi:MAG TPA: hypothetical protein VF544_03385 [Pyrinomonadaceae bacterium]|jgi:hypothetical protein
MVEDQAYGRASEQKEEEPAAEQSPSEKLEGDKTGTGSLVPGAENPDSEEIKQEKSPNTE